MNIKVGFIIDYETYNNCNIIENLAYGDLVTIIDILSHGYDCSINDAIDIMNNNIDELGFEKFINDISYDVIGHVPDDKDKDKTQDINENKRYSEVLQQYFNELQTYDNSLSISDFRDFTTHYMYVYADGVQKRYISNKNMKLQEQYDNITMLAGALTGNLKECPRLDEDGSLHKKTLDEKLEELRKVYGD
jgi:hypothetical protein